MRIILVVIPLLAVLATPFRRGLLIVPIVFSGCLSAYLAWDGLWRATGGQYGECTDVCFEPHLKGSDSAAFLPLWIVTAVFIFAAVVGPCALVVRSMMRSSSRRGER